MSLPKQVEISPSSYNLVAITGADNKGVAGFQKPVMVSAAETARVKLPECWLPVYLQGQQLRRKIRVGFLSEF